MAVPEGSRDTGEGIIVSAAMDWCLTPMGGEMVPVPYRIWARQQDVANIVNSVRQTDRRTHAKDSLVIRCYGDEPGTGGGVVSGTTGSICTPKTWSSTVRAEGRNVVRHDDERWMNNRNTFGRLVYVKDAEAYATPRVEAVRPTLGAQVDEGAADEGRGAAAGGETVGIDGRDAAVGSLGAPDGEARAIYTSAGVGELPSGPAGGPLGVGGPKGVQQAYFFPPPGVGAPPMVAPFMPPAGALPGGGLHPLPPKMRPIVPGYDPKDTVDRELFPKPGNRTTGQCETKRICFDRKSYDWDEYNIHLHLQQDAINAKTPAQNVIDIDSYSASARDESYQKAARDSYILKNQESFINRYGEAAWENHIASLAALHRLDMVAGGSATDIAGMGNANINSSIGSNWNQSDKWFGFGKKRKTQLRDYASDMDKEHCPMAVSLSTCDALKTLLPPKT